MWRYEKRLQYPVNITQPNPKMAQFIMSQYGAPDGCFTSWRKKRPGCLSFIWNRPSKKANIFRRQRNLSRSGNGLNTGYRDIGTEEPVRPPGGALLRITRLRARRLLCGKTI